MLGDRLRAKFTHIPYHYGFMCSLHSGKVVKSGRHTRRIGVVGILYQNVAICLFQLRAVVLGIYSLTAWMASSRETPKWRPTAMAAAMLLALYEPAR